MRRQALVLTLWLSCLAAFAGAALPATQAAGWQAHELREPGYYQLTAADIAGLAERQAQLAKLLALQDIVYPQQYLLDNELRQLLRPLVHDHEHYVSRLVSPAVGATADPAVNEPAPPQGSDSTTGFVVTSAALTQLQQQPAFALLTEPQLKQLQALQDAVFRQQTLLDTALDLAGFNTEAPASAMPSAQRRLVYQYSFKQGNAVMMPALNWQAAAGCGCAPVIPSQAAFVNFSYALQPYWLNTPQQLNFGSVHRIGLYAFSIDGALKLQPPPNWRNQRPYNDFVNLAQAHNTYLDIVVRSDNDALWQNAAASLALIDQMQHLITEPLRGFWLNNLQPLVTFGLSERRTVADGITLDLDLRNLPPEQHGSVISFIKTLKQQLNNRQPTSNTDSYFVNLTVPVSALLRQSVAADGKTPAAGAELGFYTLDNLLAIAPYVNLMLIRFDDKAQLSGSANTLDLPPFSSRLSGFRQGMKQLKTAIDTMEKTTDANLLLEKMLPVFHMAHFVDADSFANELTYANWNFSGAGLWSLPLNEAQYGKLHAAFNPQPNTDNQFYRGYLTASAALCNVICPHRWQARLLLFGVMGLLALYAAISLVMFELRVLYQQRIFINFLLLQPFLLLLILWCDPFWHPYQELVLVVALVITLALQWYFRQQQRRREHYP